MKQYVIRAKPIHKSVKKRKTQYLSLNNALIYFEVWKPFNQKNFLKKCLLFDTKEFAFDKWQSMKSLTPAVEGIQDIKKWLVEIVPIEITAKLP